MLSVPQQQQQEPGLTCLCRTSGWDIYMLPGEAALRLAGMVLGSESLHSRAPSGCFVPVLDLPGAGASPSSAASSSYWVLVSQVSQRSKTPPYHVSAVSPAPKTHLCADMPTWLLWAGAGQKTKDRLSSSLIFWGPLTRTASPVLFYRALETADVLGGMWCPLLGWCVLTAAAVP